MISFVCQITISSLFLFTQISIEVLSESTLLLLNPELLPLPLPSSSGYREFPGTHLLELSFFHQLHTEKEVWLKFDESVTCIHYNISESQYTDRTKLLGLIPSNLHNPPPGVIHHVYLPLVVEEELKPVTPNLLR